MSTNTKTEVIDHTCVSVTFIGPRGGHQEILVNFDRRGQVKFGFGEKGALLGYREPDLIPDFVKHAAKEALDAYG